MKKAIVVRKNRGRRIGVAFFSASLVASLSFLCAQKDYASLAAVCLPISLSSIVLSGYYCTWNLSLSSDKVIKQVFHITMFEFPYSKIIDITSSFSSTEYDHIRILFSNGKQVVFRMDDDNAGKAIAKLCSHHSIHELK